MTISSIVKVGDRKFVKELLVAGRHELISWSDPLEVVVTEDSTIELVMEWRRRPHNQHGEWIKMEYLPDSIRTVPVPPPDPELVEYYKLPWWKKLFTRKPGIPRMFMLPPADPDDGFI